MEKKNLQKAQRRRGRMKATNVAKESLAAKNSKAKE
jgi:hypothetical protein